MQPFHECSTVPDLEDHIKALLIKLQKPLMIQNLSKNYMMQRDILLRKYGNGKKIIADNGFSLDLSTVQVHEKFFSTLMRGLSMMTSLHKVEWTIKSGTPRSYDYLIELKEGNIDYWYIRYVDRIISDEERKKALTAIYGEFAKLKLGGKIKVSCATPSYEDYDYFVTIPPYQLNTNASIIHFDSELERFADETFLETALPLKENIPVKDFCNLTEPLIL